MRYAVIFKYYGEILNRLINSFYFTFCDDFLREKYWRNFLREKDSNQFTEKSGIYALQLFVILPLATYLGKQNFSQRSLMETRDVWFTLNSWAIDIKWSFFFNSRLLNSPNYT